MSKSRSPSATVDAASPLLGTESSNPDRDPSLAGHDLPGAGNAMLLARMKASRPPVQASGARDLTADHIQGAAAQGVQGTGHALPFLSAIQASFGHHDVGDVHAHVGGKSAEATREMGANAYARGTDVVSAEPLDKHTAAHEAAHVVQQRAGVQLSGGVGRPGDAYERHADQVADLVVRGQSAEGLLDRFARPGATAGRGRPAVQRDENDEALRRYLDRDQGPPVTDWGSLVSPTAGAVPTGSWTGSPAMKNDCNARCHAPAADGPEREIWDGSLRFMAQWSQVQGSYNRVATLAGQSGITSEWEFPYKPLPGPSLIPGSAPRVDLLEGERKVKVKAGETIPNTGGKTDIDGAYDDKNNVDAGRFDPRGLSEADTKAYDDAKQAALDSRGAALTQKISVDQAMTHVGSAFSKVAQANISVRKAEAEGDKQEKTTEKGSVTAARDKIAARVKAASTLFTGLADATTGKDKNAKAKGAVKVAEGALTLAVSEHYAHRLAEIDSAIGGLNQTIASLSVEYQMEAVTQAVNAVTIAKGEVVKAKIVLDEKIRAQNAAFVDLGTVVARLAKSQGRSEDDQINLAAAAAAIPHIEQVLSYIGQIRPNISVPMYSHPSGLGAAQCTNLSEFTRHTSELFGFGMELPGIEQTWADRLASAKQVLGLSLPTY